MARFSLQKTDFEVPTTGVNAFTASSSSLNRILTIEIPKIMSVLRRGGLPIASVGDTRLRADRKLRRLAQQLIVVGVHRIETRFGAVQ
jgi:hypothetical protein